MVPAISGAHAVCPKPLKSEPSVVGGWYAGPTFAGIAQLVEQRFCKPPVVGSKPSLSSLCKV